MPETIQLTEPCGQRWADMPARGGGRYCARCDQTVIDMGRLTRAEALDRMRGGGVCGRALLGEDGQPIFRREPQRLGLRALTVLGALAGGCGSAASQDEPTSIEAVEEPPTEVTAAAVMRPLPTVPEGVAVDELPSEQLARFDARLEEMSAALEPTEEQRRLTAAKRRRRTAAAAPPPGPPHAFMGGMMFEPNL